MNFSNSLTSAVNKSRVNLYSLLTWMAAQPKPIRAYPGEKELLRSPTVLVTDTRIAYMDGLERTLKTYMFEHMISVDKNYYRPSTLNRRLCKAVVLGSIMSLLIAIILDITGSSSKSLLIAYIPLLSSLTFGLWIWRDMRPAYRLEWQMINGAVGKIRSEPYLREWLTDNRNRENFMNKLAAAMNEALSGKAWWPNNPHANLPDKFNHTPTHKQNMVDEPANKQPPAPKKLKLINDLYDQ